MRRIVSLLALAAILTAACGSTPPSLTAPTSAAAAAPSAVLPSPSVSTAAVPDDTVWLCKPGLAGNPCAGSLDATVFAASGASTVERAAPASDPPIDCFYVYPTVSKQSGTNANLTIDPEERAVAVAQAARFSQVCRVYAPMYPQLTLAAIARPDGITLPAALVAYSGVDSSFRNYMANYNHGRGVVFIGHSQGAMMLTALLRGEVDPNPATRRLLVSALLLGGNVTVPVGKSVGGDFANIPACAAPTQIGCVVAYSSFDRIPPSNAFFGRTDTGLNPFPKASSVPMQILCVNPAAPAGGTGALLPYFPTAGLSSLIRGSVPKIAATTPYIAYPGEYSAHCVSRNGTTWLQVDRTGGAADHRPALAVSETPTWGLHVVDLNIALGNLVDLVRSESAAFR